MDAALEHGVKLFNAREFFECHEALEAAWVKEQGPRRRFLQSIIHLAVACYHQERANPVGAIRQFEKGLDKLGPFRPEYEGLDTARLYAEAEACLRSVVAGITAAIPSIHRV